MKTKDEPRAKLKLLKSSAFTIDTPEHLPKMHFNMLLCGKRGSGKSVAATNMLRMLMEGNALNRILVVSPTFNGNKLLMKDLNIKETDVFSDPDDPTIPQRIMDIVDEERDEFLRYQHLVKQYENVMKMIKTGGLHQIESGAIDEYLLAYFNPMTNEFNLPKPRWERYREGKPGVLALFVDDSICTKLMSNRKFFNLVTRHRWLGQFPEGGAVGLSLMIAIQNYKAQSGGCNKVVRNNCTHLCLFRTKDESELKSIGESFSGEISVDKFYKVYEKATDEPHSFLFVDLHKKDTQPSMFRKRFDQYLIPDEVEDSEEEQQ